MALLSPACFYISLYNQLIFHDFNGFNGHFSVKIFAISPPLAPSFKHTPTLTQNTRRNMKYSRSKWSLKLKYLDLFLGFFNVKQTACNFSEFPQNFCKAIFHHLIPDCVFLKTCSLRSIKYFAS